MLGHLKVRLASLQEEIVKSLSNVPVSSEEPKYIPEDVDLEAGCELLEYYQNQWEEIRNANEGNIRLGHEADATILKLKDSLDSQWNHISTLSGLVAQIPAINEDIRGIMNTLGSLDSSFTDVEIALFALEDTIETRKLQEKQLDQRFQIAIYQERRQAEFNDLSAKLQKSYEKQIQDLELKRVLSHPGSITLQDLPGPTRDKDSLKKTSIDKVESEVNLEVIDLNEEEDEEVKSVLGEGEGSDSSPDPKAICTIKNPDDKEEGSFYFTPNSTSDKLELLHLEQKSD
uniref:Dysbindin n=1 Tax=Caligus rogercresseyi TaxID=217165 RepID=C1BNX7_CALRO|nr:Dysbindin [Caligus rogercresseyi]